MEWSDDIRQALLAAFPSEEIEFLPKGASNGRALALAYVDARAVMTRLDSVVGPDGWDFQVQVVGPKSVIGTLTVLGAVRQDAGEAGPEDEPLKSAVSDALKRCAVHFGIARYLGRLPQIWVAYDAQKRRFTEAPRFPPGTLQKALAASGWRGETQPAAAGPSPGKQRAQEGVEAAETAPSYAGEATAKTKQPKANDQAAAPAEPPVETGEVAEGMACADCGKSLTKGQHDISMRAFGRGLCPAHQREQAKAA